MQQWWMPTNVAALMGGVPESGNDANTVALLHFNGIDGGTTFTDSNSGGSAHTWTAAGNAQLDTADKKFDSASGLFDGTGDYISTPDHADWNLGTGNFTVDFWFKVNGGNGTFRNMCRAAHATSPFLAFEAYLTTSNTARFVANLPNLGSRTVTGTTAFTAASGWVHFAAVRSGINLTLYLNGTSESTIATLSTEAMRDADDALLVGCGGTSASPSEYWNGWIDEFRISKGIARWTENFTPPTAAYGPG